MKIREVRSRRESVRLTRPYAIAGRRMDSVELFYVEVVTDGETGLGSASPSRAVTGETAAACAAALEEADALLRGENGLEIGRLQQLLDETLHATPAARAAVDMALWDAFGRRLELPLVDLWGRRHSEPLETSITVGIQSVEASLADAEEYLERGFRCLKVKIGDEFDLDLERLEALRRLAQRHPAAGEISLRVDGNRGLAGEELRELVARSEDLGLELIEQPLEVAEDDALRALPFAARRLLAADESLVREADALGLLARGPEAVLPFQHWNLKLMKHGGPTPARRLAHLAHTAGLGLMWGCMDESVVSIAAALHAAYASPATRRLDLDGSFDLASDAFEGGFRLEAGRLHLLDAPGLGMHRL